MTRSSLIGSVVALSVLALAGCDASQEPLVPAVPQPALTPGGHDPDQHALARAIPAFGGLFLDAHGTPTVFLTDPSARGSVTAALSGFLAERGVGAAQLKVLPARFSYAQLETMLERARPDVFSGPGTVFTDLDETRNQIVIGVQNANAASRVMSALAPHGLPAGAVAVELAEPIYPLVNLTDRFDPIPAGVQIHFGNYLCSIGIIANVASQSHFVTASHCTNTQGGIEGTQYYQPLSSVDATAIGTEVADPNYFNFKNGCPYHGVNCRYSDAALVRSSGARAFALGSIAQTAPNSLTWTGGYFTVSGKASGNGTVGSTRSKVGRTTGYTTGTVSRSCVDTGVQGSNKVLLCQDWVDGSGTIVGGGDSGSGVFAGTSNVTWWGILWGGNSSGNQFIYSPASNVESELGSLVVSGGGGGGGGGGGTPTLGASFSFGCHFSDCTFDASASTGATNYSWNFGDGVTAAGVTTAHQYASDGNYTVTLTVSNGSDTDSSSQSISCTTRGKNLQCK